VSKVVDFAGTITDFTKKFYRNPVAIGSKDIAIEDGRLEKDVALVVTVQGHDPVFIALPKDKTADNKNIGDLFADLNDAIKAARADDLLFAERRAPFKKDQVKSVSAVSETADHKFKQFTVTFDLGGTTLTALGFRQGNIIRYETSDGETAKGEVV